MVREEAWQPGAAALAALAGPIAAAWADSGDQPGDASAGGISAELSHRVLTQLRRAVEDPGAIDDLAAGLTEPGEDLAVCVRHAAELRRIVHQHLAGVLGPEAATATGRAVDAALDGALEVAARRLAGVLEEAAFVDPLTGLANRRALDVDLVRAVANASRAGTALTVVMIDLDGLKATNDAEGHAAGDAALRRLAGTLQAGLRGGDSAYRIGGDEFVLLLPGAAAEATATIIARVHAAGPPPFSWGAAAYPSGGTTPAALLREADARLYAGREARPGRISRSRTGRRAGWNHLLALGFRLATIALPAAAAAALVSSGRPPLQPPRVPPRVPPRAPSAIAPPRQGQERPTTTRPATLAGRRAPSVALALANAHPLAPPATTVHTAAAGDLAPSLAPPTLSPQPPPQRGPPTTTPSPAVPPATPPPAAPEARHRHDDDDPDPEKHDAGPATHRGHGPHGPEANDAYRLVSRGS